METIANRIKLGLTIRNMKQSELVEKTKIGKSSISTYISGAYEPKQRNIYKIAQALNVNEAWLMGYDVPMERTTDTNNHIEYKLSKEEQQHIDDLRALNDLGKNKVITYTKDLLDNPKFINNDELCATKVVELPKKEKYIWEEPGKEHLMPVACHDDGLTDEERAIVNERLNEILKNIDKY